MIINSLEKLRELSKTFELESDGSSSIKVLIGMGTCGIAAGAVDTKNEIQKILDEKNITNVDIIGVGCVGFCCMEPTVEVYRPNEKPLLYGPINVNMARELVEKVIEQSSFLDDDLLIQTYEKVGM